MKYIEQYTFVHTTSLHSILLRAGCLSSEDRRIRYSCSLGNVEESCEIKKRNEKRKKLEITDLRFTLGARARPHTTKPKDVL